MVQQAAALGERIAGLGELIRKNWDALLRRRGFERVRRRAGGSARSQARWTRPAPQPAAARPDPVLADPARFFSVEIEARPGINHLRFALELLVREAAALGRTPVVFEPRFDPRHNGGHELRAGWRKYLDLDAIELVHAASGRRMAVRALQRSEVAGFDTLPAAWFERGHRVTEAEHRQHALIVRLNKTGLAVDAVHEGPAGLPGYTVRLPASAPVRAAAAAVQARLGVYGAMHVRRGDMLAMQEQYPNLARDTRPERIAEVLRAHLPAGSRVYVMTNERDPAYFEPLRGEYEILQCFDFPELKALIEGPAPDNFFLFEVEKLLFEQAATRIHTFTHPEGGMRIALSTDKGWA